MSEAEQGRERFDSWWKEQTRFVANKELTLTVWDAAWQARDAEVDALKAQIAHQDKYFADAAIEVVNAKDEVERMAAFLSDREAIGRIMHESWSKTKRAQGYHLPSEQGHEIPPPSSFPNFPTGAGKNYSFCTHCHPDLVPWEQLPEAQKDINRHAFDAVAERALASEGGE